jgi:monothiol glutaredoxin
MKGSPDSPQCGFSSRATQLLISCGKPFSFVDILSNPEIRANLPKVSDWPTFPQLFVDGDLVGGSDIMVEMDENGELQKLIDTIESET